MLTRTTTPAATADRPKVANNHAARVLVVDDDPLMIDLMGLVLRSLNCRVDTALSGPEAILYLERTVYDLVLTDLQMPSMTGLQLAGWIRKHWPDTVLVIMTGCPDVDNYVQHYPDLADSWLLKPFDRQDLLAVLRKFFPRRPGTAAEAPGCSGDLDGKRQRVVGPDLSPIELSAKIPTTTRGSRCESTQLW